MDDDRRSWGSLPSEKSLVVLGVGPCRVLGFGAHQHESVLSKDGIVGGCVAYF